MQRIIGIITFSFLLVSFCHAQTETVQQPSSKEDGSPASEMTFESMEVDYGVIEHNAEPYREFHYTNTGNAPLVISNAKGSCGCTVPEWSKEPLAPGKSGIIKVRYATNRIGKFSKTITLTTNEPDSKHVLKIKGEVLKDKTPTPTSQENAVKPKTGKNE